jgi:hypothetical protein
MLSRTRSISWRSRRKRIETWLSRRR